VSGGFNADPGRQYFDIINDYLQRQGEGIDTVDFATKFPTSVRETKFDVRTMVKNSVGKLNKLDMTVYSINTRGMYDSSDNIDVSRSEFAQWDNSYLQDYQESLTQIAEETGGSAFQNSQNFKKGFDLLLADLSHQYELCYHSPQHDKPGKYHKIEVRVSRKGLDVRFRRGYVD
jgi:VWFA-related protein